MPDPSVPPPLKVFQVGGSSYVPVFELELSGGTVTKQSPIRVRYSPTATTGVAASRIIATTAPLAGGGDLSVDRTHTLDTAAVVTSGRSLSTLYPLAGGGDLSANRTFSVDSAFLVTSARQILSVFPLVGGGNLGTDQTLSATTGGFLVLSSRTINTTYPLAGGGNLAVDRTLTVDSAFLVTSGRQVLAGPGISGGGNLGADVTLSLVTPVVVPSGGTGATTLASFGLLYGSGASAVQVLAPMSAGSLVVGSGVTTRPHIVGSGGAGQYLISTGGVVGGVAWVNTLGGATAVTYAPTGGSYLTYLSEANLGSSNVLTAGTGISMASNATTFFVSVTARTVRVPMALMTVAPDSSNAFWAARTGGFVDQGYVAYLDSGIGWATYWTTVPFNIASTPLWSVWAYNTPNSGSGGFCIFSLSARVVGQGATVDAAYTNMVTVGTIFAQTSNVLGVGTTIATNFDSTLPIATSGGNMLLVEFTRHGQLAGDTVNATWNLLSLSLQCDVK